MRFYWFQCRQQQEQCNIYWEPGKTNLADYFTKHHSPAHHKAVRPIYLQDPDQPIDLKGSIKILTDRATPKKRAQRRPGQPANSAVTVIGTLRKANQILAQLTTRLAEV